jgi:hypothetical protein
VTCTLGERSITLEDILQNEYIETWRLYPISAGALIKPGTKGKELLLTQSKSAPDDEMLIFDNMHYVESLKK